MPMIDTTKTLALLTSRPQPGFVLTNKKTVLELIKRGYLYHAQKVQDETGAEFGFALGFDYNIFWISQKGKEYLRSHGLV